MGLPTDVRQALLECRFNLPQIGRVSETKQPAVA
jgi:hypothetical protein